MQDFHDLRVWEKSHALAKRVYAVTEAFPKGEQFGLVSQLRRVAVSIPTNIAEGCGRTGRPEFAHFTQIAMGSAAETEYLLLLSTELGFVTEESYAPLANLVIEVKRMLCALHDRLRQASVRELPADYLVTDDDG